jgi:hypothetical protein
MKIKKLVFGVIFLFTVLFSACAQQYNSENDFEIYIGSTGVIIEGYRGTSKIVRIPPRIRQRPVVEINEDAFMEKQLTSVIIPDTVTHIENSAFYGNQLTSVTIPNSVESIESSAFANNDLVSIVLPDSISIAHGVFRNNLLTTITIGKDVDIDEDDWAPAFDNGFRDYYYNNGQRSGTYTFKNGQWSAQYR